ncbi:MAG: formylglycine-generating enzyme family protein, partial [Gammaproteobacteria bacterium]|nr:formylglycine-generating enzyme family protein [Gammaproteobacteria bacterium]
MAILDPNPPQFPAAWATSYGQDRFGLWQGLEINGVRQVMRWIPPGRFMMGSNDEEPDRDSDEAQHQVTISKGFYMADTACTQALWSAVMEGNPSEFNDRPENPVDTVSWNDCQNFIDRANKTLHGQFKLRLPSESEWEYAARGGSQTAFWWG